MNFFRQHKKIWTLIVIIASISLIITSLLPLFSLR